jgi:hemolysin activation/secretion protein
MPQKSVAPPRHAQRVACYLTSAFLISVAIPAAAQIVPGQLPTREQVQPPVPQPRVQARARVDGRGAFRDTPCPFEASNQRAVLGSVRFVGIDGEDLPGKLTALLGSVQPGARERPVAELCELRDRANALLRDAGYVASVQILPQDIASGGVLTLTVITARLVKVESGGQSNGHYARLLSRAVARLQGMTPFNQREAERQLLLLGDVPGLDVDLTLRPAGTRPGDVIGTLSVRYHPVAITANVQNYGARTAGRETAYARAELYGLTGLADVTYVGGSTTFDLDEQQVLQLGHGFGLGDDGIRLDTSLTFAWAQPDIGALDLRSRSTIATLGLSAPVVRRLDRNASAVLGLDVIDQRTDVHFSGVGVPLTRDRLRVAFARLSGNLARPSQTGRGYWLSAAIEGRRGLSILGASERFRGVYSAGYTPSNLAADPRATVIRLDADAQIGLGPVFSFAGALRGQAASGPLLNYEKFSIGSLTVGRGYDPGANNGDSALGLRGEFRTAVARSPRVLAEVFGFYDQAWLWNLDRLNPEHGRSLGAFGGGVRAAIGGKLLLEAMYARPKDRALRSDRRRPADRLLLSLTTQFSPAIR